jgi:hypothetical protein
VDVAEAGGDKRRSAAVTLAPLLALSALLDELARALGVWLVVEKIVTSILPFAKAHSPAADLVASLTLFLVALLLLKVVGPKLPEQLNGLGYLALLVAAVVLYVPLARYVIPGTAPRPSRAGELTAGNLPKRIDHASGGSHAKASRTRSRRQTSAPAASSPSGPSERRPVASYHAASASTGSSDTTVGGSSNRTETGNPASRDGDSPQPAKQTHTPAPATRSPGVEFEGSKPTSPAPPAKTSPAVEVKSEKERASGIEVAN